MAPKKRKHSAAHPQAAARVACPACQKEVPSFFVNSHLDLECPALKAAPRPPEVGILPIDQNTCNPSLKNEQAPVSSLVSERVGDEEFKQDEVITSTHDSPDAGHQSEVPTDHFSSTQGCWQDESVMSPEGHEFGKRKFETEGPISHSSISPLVHCEEESTEADVVTGGSCSVGRFPTNIRSLPLPSPPKPIAPRGLQVIKNFITAEEEKHLLHCLDNDMSNPWKLSRINGLHIGKSYGNHIFGGLKRRVVLQASRPMPKFIEPFVDRMRDDVPLLKGFFPNEMNAIDYRKAQGHYLKAHMDDRQLSGTVLVNLSLGGCCFMTYTRERGLQKAFRVKLLPRSLQVVTGESRYSFTHGIQKDDIIDSRRVSMTFRQSVETLQADDIIDSRRVV